jgi:GlpG protein
MLMITSFTNPRVAQAFVDYMATQGVILTIQQHTQTDVWLADESQAERVNAELARFLENPGDPRYLAASWQSGQTGSGLHYRRFPFLATVRARRAVYPAADGRLYSGVHHHERGGRPERDDSWHGRTILSGV